MTKPKTIAIYGGSFDPFSSGHAAVIRWLIEKCHVGLHEVWVLPTVNHAFDKGLLPYETRELMVGLALDEMYRQSLFGTVNKRKAIKVVKREEKYTVETLEALHAEYPDYTFHLVLGADIQAETDKWERWDDVVKLATPMWVTREGYVEAEDTHIIDAPEVSSSSIRERLSRSDLTYLVGIGADLPKTVLEYITTKELYGYKKAVDTRSVLSIETVDLPVAVVTDKFKPGVSFSLIGPFSQILGVSSCRVGSLDKPGIQFTVLRDTAKDNRAQTTLRSAVRAWQERQTLARHRGKEFTDDQPELVPAQGPGIAYLVRGGEPVEGFIAGDLIGQVGDIWFFNSSGSGGIFGGLFGF
jgi:nicotinate-nucleotide adenylyltransferase